MCDFREIGFDGANDADRCICKPHVLNAYEGMIGSGASQKSALEAAYRVYRNYHPDDSKEDSRLTVERWVLAQTLH
jgi:hypothetical protein